MLGVVCECEMVEDWVTAVASWFFRGQGMLLCRRKK